MSKVALLLVVATATVVAVQGFPYEQNSIPKAINDKDWDKLHLLLRDVYRREFGANFRPIQGYNAQQLQPGVQTFAAPQQRVYVAAASPTSGAGPHSIGSAISSFSSSRTGPDGVTTVQHGGGGIINRDGTITRFDFP